MLSRLYFTLVLLLVFLFTACTQNNNTPQATPSLTVDATRADSEGETPSSTPEQNIVDDSAEPTEQDEITPVAPSPEISATPLPIETREVPEDYNWKELPIQPEISQHALDIYEHGLALGRDASHISVIGDCQAIPFVFLGRYGLQQYTLNGTDTRLEPMIATFRDSFERKGAAVRGGFTAAAVLSPVRADPDMCMPGENPLECEWRIHNPSIAFINLETWREEGTVDRYELYLQKIVEYTLEQGTLPIIIIKADKAESETHVINPAMARVAYQYDVPIINFWRAVQYIENRGIDPERDGFHLSQEGYELKEILALRTLYEVWSQYQSEEAQATPLPSKTPIPTATPEAVSLEYPSFDCEDNCLYYDFFTQSSGGIAPQGIYEFNLDTGTKQLLLEKAALLDVSGSQQKFLVSRNNELYLLDRENQSAELVVDTLYPFSDLNAYFTADESTIIALTSENGQNQIEIIDTATLAIKETIQPEDAPINLLNYADMSRIFYEAGTCSGLHFCTVESIHEFQTEIHKDTMIDGKERLVFSSDGESVAFRDPQYADEINYYHNPLLLHENVEEGINSRRLFSFTHPGGFRVHPEITEYVYSPDGSKLFVLQDAYSDYFEKSVGLYLYLEDLDLRMVLDHGMLEGAYGSLSPIPVWSPAGDELLLLLINTENDRDFTLELFRKDILNRFSEFEELMEPQVIDGYGYPGHAFWLKELSNEEN